MVVVGLLSAGNLSPGEREDRSNRWVLAAFGVIGLLAAYLPALTDRLDFWTFDGDAVRWLGVVLFAGGGALRIWPVFVLGRRFSGLVAIQPGHTLVTTGIYSVIRNPSYLGNDDPLPRLGAGVPVSHRCPARGSQPRASRRPHPRRGGAAPLAVRRRSTMPTAAHVETDPWLY